MLGRFGSGGIGCSGRTITRWNGDARLEINFYAKPGGKAQIAVQVGKLAKKSDVDRERAAWKKALAKLESLVGK